MVKIKLFTVNKLEDIQRNDMYRDYLAWLSKKQKPAGAGKDASLRAKIDKTENYRTTRFS